jgi:hypothetical protein
MIQDKGALFKGDSVEEGPKLQLSALNTRRASERPSSALRTPRHYCS